MVIGAWIAIRANDCPRTLSAASRFSPRTGNGITLCSICHREMHQGFNARPDLSAPVDAQGGEKLAAMERLYSILTDDAVERGLMREDFYFLSDELLASFKRMQGYDPTTFAAAPVPPHDAREHARAWRALARRDLRTLPPRVVLPVDAWGDAVPVPAFGPRMVCTRCGIVVADVRPNWRQKQLRADQIMERWFFTMEGRNVVMHAHARPQQPRQFAQP